MLVSGMAHFPEKELRKLWGTLETLLAPGGCPWDREQSSLDINRHLIEEAHEWREAIETKRADHQAEEIGDLAYLLFFALQNLQAEKGIEASSALAGIDRKLRRRHPDLFEGKGESPETAEERLQSWESVKREERREKGEDPGLLKPLPRSMDTLARAWQYQEKAARVGFDWPTLDGVLAKLREEMGELEEALSELPREVPDGPSPSLAYRKTLEEDKLPPIQDEIGDLVFVLVNLCRWLGLSAEEVGNASNEKFLRRFACMEKGVAGQGLALEETDLDTMEEAWRDCKKAERD